MNKGSVEYKEFRRKANERNRKYYSKPEVKEKRKLYKKEYEKNNLAKIRAREKAYRENPINKERQKKWRADNRERIREYRRQPEQKRKKAESDKRYREKNKEKLKAKRNSPQERARKKVRYEANKEHLKEVRRAYYKTARGKLSVMTANHRRLARKKDRETDLDFKKIKEIYERDKCCVYCGAGEPFELDHIIPLAHQGSCMSNNIVLSCPPCNRSKHGREVFNWCKLQGIEVPPIVLELLEEQKSNNA